LLPKPVKYLITTVMIVVGVIAMYTILNAGRPDSLLRPLFPDPTADVYVAVAASLTVFILGFFIFFERDRQGFKGLVRMNADQIKRLREEGQADGVIADSILNAMGSTSGYRHNLARKKLLIALSEFDHRSEPQA
jgi:hypothetical protein